MVRSMTGFGRGENSSGDRKFIVEIKSVNHRYNDISIKLPRTMNFLEEKVRNYLKTEIARGKTDVYISYESYSKEDVEIQLNIPVADAYVEQLQNISERYNIINDINVSLVAKFPEVIAMNHKVGDENFLWNLLYPALEIGLKELVSMRTAEGNALTENIYEKLQIMEDFVIHIRSKSQDVVMEYQKKLSARLKELLKDQTIDESRVITEIAIFADRCSIDEELVRLKSHINQMREILRNESIIGRKLDFLAQEMNREANTITSKANNIDITNDAIGLKNEIEKIREQIQNIE